MIIVTSYDSPDLDGVACAIGYAELLNNLSRPAKAVYFGDLGLEVEFVKNYTKNLPLSAHSGPYDPDSEFVLVDTADPGAIDPAIPVEKVVEIFDHRQLVFTQSFINAKLHIDQVGSCATLIAEQFKEHQLTPSLNTSIYLYSAIVSNTINFKNSVTTSRDIDIALWLKDITKLDDQYTRQMFQAKSTLTPDNLYEVLFQDFAIKEIHGKKVGISQIEIVDILRMNEDLLDSLKKTLNRFKSENGLDYLLFTGIDIIKGFNLFYTIDDNSQKLFSKVLSLPDFYPGIVNQSIIMRKQIWPQVEVTLKQG